ncbi:MAG: hypothetical protein NVS2B7_33950 [Herpetosiphon sp.]
MEEKREQIKGHKHCHQILLVMPKITLAMIPQSFQHTVQYVALLAMLKVMLPMILFGFQHVIVVSFDVLAGATRRYNRWNHRRRQWMQGGKRVAREVLPNMRELKETGARLS